MAWDEAKKQKAIDLYVAGKPTAENSMELVKEVAEELKESPNGVRMILSKAEVYVKKEPSKVDKKDKPEGKTTTRVSKEAAIESLKEELQVAGIAVEAEIVDKLTGKAALYFANAIKSLTAG